ncbi:MAG: GerMN domain-containing protein [Clostridia bacterium]|nr:GerMN domain-containing protein [Clostridia bacterium]MCI1999230.1 GerMN domain-containing protein [Clostridia bacterium]MCI2014817.1 GerMN domain-containing protein [Clostridia bacterium]
MRKFKLVIIVFCFCAAIVLVAALTANFKDNSGKTSQNQGLDIYYVNTDTLEIKSEKENVDGASPDEILNNAIKAMKSKPNDEELHSAIPDNVDVLSIKATNQTAYVDFSSGYYELGKSEEMCLRGALVWTLTGLYFVDNVDITIEGSPLLKTDGEKYGDANRENTIISASIVADPATTVKVIDLYFSNADGTGLNKEERKIEVNKNQPLEKYVMEELIKGPYDEGNVATVPSETKIRNISTTDGICYVDLSSDFVTKHNGGTTGETLTVYSIVDSLTALDNIDKVQFLIEGEKQDEFKGHMEFSQPFEAKDVSP